MISTNQLKNGNHIEVDGTIYKVVEFQHVKPGKGPAFVRTKLKNVLSGKVVDKTYNAGVKVETATVDRRDTTYLYRDGSDFVFMDAQDYEQHPLPESLVLHFVTPPGVVRFLFDRGARESGVTSCRSDRWHPSLQPMLRGFRVGSFPHGRPAPGRRRAAGARAHRGLRGTAR